MSKDAPPSPNTLVSEDDAAKMLKRRSSSATQLVAGPPLKFEPGVHLKVTVWLKRNMQKFQDFSTLIFGDVGSASDIRSLSNESLEGRWAIPSTVLEHECISFCVALTPLLAHFDEKIRDAVAYTFVDLAEIFDPDTNYYDKTRIIIDNLKDAQDVYEPIHKLFHQIGPALQTIMLAYVVGLEGLYLHHDATCRDTAITIVSRMVIENHLVNGNNEQSSLTIVCNLIFLLDDGDASLHSHGHRLSAIAALGLLAEHTLKLSLLTW